MEKVGVITGDIVKSSQIKSEHKDTLIKIIHELKKDVSDICSIEIEFFRGDSFQILVNDVKHTLLIAIILRAKLRCAASKVRCDARVSIGIGSIEYINESIKLSDGEAFRFSGRGLDNIGKKNCLIITTPWQAVNDEFAISTPFVDDIISNWTKYQANTIFISLSTNTTQKDVSTIIDKSTQNVSKLLNTAKEQLIRPYINRFMKLIEANL
ncbi:MAG: hypothetical protein R3Y26_02920 [Rikenellaceae bacterium]